MHIDSSEVALMLSTISEWSLVCLILKGAIFFMARSKEGGST